jgi:hypothetical protein
LTDHLLLNLKQIADCLGKSENDVVILLHQIINGFEKKEPCSGLWILNKKEMTRLWEKEFFKKYIEPALLQLEADVARHRVVVKEDRDEASSVLFNILYELRATTKDRSKILSLPQFWYTC